VEQDDDAWRRESQHRRSFEVWEVPPERKRPEHLFIQPVVLGVASGSLPRPFAVQTSGRGIRHTLDKPDDPSPSLPKKVVISRSSSRLFRPPNEPYQVEAEKTRNKDLKNHDGLDDH
jgi:hypothetical protein